MRKSSKNYRRQSTPLEKLPTTRQLNGNSYATQSQYVPRSVETRDLDQHSLVNARQNQQLREYEVGVKNSFDNIEANLKIKFAQKTENDVRQLNQLSGVSELSSTYFNKELVEELETTNTKIFQKMYVNNLFAQFLNMSSEFFNKDPLRGKDKTEAENIFKDAGFHSVGLASCSDGRLAHLTSYILRLPYSLVRKKAHAGTLFDVSESVRNWVFVEHNRFRENAIVDTQNPERYLKIAVYHFSEKDPKGQGCAAHGSNEEKAAEAALKKLKDFRQAIENRFGCASAIQTLLIGANTDNDSLKIHVPNSDGNICLQRFLTTKDLYTKTLRMSADEARIEINNTIDASNVKRNSTPPQANVKKVVAWLIENNFSQIAYVDNYEKGLYSDIGHAERFIGVGNGFEEVQLRNLSYYSFLETIEEGTNDIDVGIKIFKKLNISKGLPIPIIIRCDYDGRVPGSKDRAMEKARRIDTSLHNRYAELSQVGLIETLLTLRDYTDYDDVEVLSKSDSKSQL